MKPISFGRLADGTEIFSCKLAAPGIRATILTYGGIIQSLEVPDRMGHYANVVLGLPLLADYVDRSPFFGAIVGRYANRIAKGRFTLGGHEYQLACNDGPNALHGGPGGFSHQPWTIDAYDRHRIRLSRVSPAGEEGYPGKLTMQVTYSLGEGALRIDYDARTEAPTVLNLSNHSYWNLSGEGSGDILGHVLTIPADRFTPVDNTQIPTGALEPVEGTPFDFRVPARIGARLGADDKQLLICGGYDHNWILNRKSDGSNLHLAAQVYDPVSGRNLEVRTDQPGIQFYSGNYLDGTLTGLGENLYGHRDGLALESQHFPDSPNQPEFPDTILRPGILFNSTTIYKFDARI